MARSTLWFSSISISTDRGTDECMPPPRKYEVQSLFDAELGDGAICLLGTCMCVTMLLLGLNVSVKEGAED